MSITRKTCKVCKEEKEISFFTKSHSTCKKCRAMKNRLYRKNHPGYEAECSRKKRFPKIAYISLLKNKPCLDCHVLYPICCMDFDHISDKKCSIARMISGGFNMTVLKEEIAKCELVCSNCHRIRTYLRRLEKNGKAALTTSPK